jgi:hypothetical protein
MLYLGPYLAFSVNTADEHDGAMLSSDCIPPVVTYNLPLLTTRHRNAQKFSGQERQVVCSNTLIYAFLALYIETCPLLMFTSKPSVRLACCHQPHVKTIDAFERKMHPEPKSGSPFLS